VAPLLILAHAAEASKEKEFARCSTNVAEASKEKEAAGGSTAATTSRDGSFLGDGGAVPVLVQHPRRLWKILRCRFRLRFVLLGERSLYSILLHFVI
jgi:hypothetical protein